MSKQLQLSHYPLPSPTHSMSNNHDCHITPYPAQHTVCQTIMIVTLPSTQPNTQYVQTIMIVTLPPTQPNTKYIKQS